MFQGPSITDFQVHALRLQEHRDYAERHNRLATPEAVVERRSSVVTRLRELMARPARVLTPQYGS